MRAGACSKTLEAVMPDPDVAPPDTTFTVCGVAELENPAEVRLWTVQPACRWCPIWLTHGAGACCLMFL